MSKTIPDLYCRMLYPAASDSVTTGLAFTVIQKHSLDLLGPDFFSNKPQFVGNGQPVDLTELIRCVYQNTLPSDFHVQRVRNLEGFSILQIENFIGDILMPIPAGF
jgi:hypothetical protein